MQTVEQASSALAAAKEQQQAANEELGRAKGKLDAEGTVESARALEAAERECRAMTLLVESRKRTLEKAQAQAEVQAQAEAAKHAQSVQARIANRRQTLGPLVHAFVEHYRVLQGLVADAEAFARAEERDAEELSDAATRAQVDVPHKPLTLNEVRATVAVGLREAFGVTGTPDINMIGTGLERALQRIAGGIPRRIPDVARELELALQELCELVGSNPEDWMRPALPLGWPATGPHSERLKHAADILTAYAQAAGEQA